MNKRSIGTQKEAAAQCFLETRGVSILEHSYRCRLGEIDLIGIDRRVLVFFEVKYRHSAEWGNPAEAVTWKKQSVISRVADSYCLSHDRVRRDCCGIRFDVIAILGNEITWYQNAFDYYGKGW